MSDRSGDARAGVLKDWSFSVEEISAGVYLARGIDSMGRRVEATGTDPDALLEQCKRAAAEIANTGPPTVE